MECSWERRRSYFFLLRNLKARQATCQEAALFSQGNVHDSLTLKYVKGDILPHPRPHSPPPHPVWVRGVTSGRGRELGTPGNWGWVSPGIASMLDPLPDVSLCPGPPHLHTNINTTGVCLQKLQVVVQFLPSPRARTFTTPRIPIRSRRQRVERQVNQILRDETSQV